MAHLDPDKAHLRHVRSTDPSPAPSTTSHHSRRSLPHPHAQHREIYVPADEFGADVVGLSNATPGLVQQVEDEMEDEEEAEAEAERVAYAQPYRYHDSEGEDAIEHDRSLNRRRSVTWVDQTPSSVDRASLAAAPRSGSSSESPLSTPSKTAGTSHTHIEAAASSPPDSPSSHGAGEESVDWAALREGSIARRPRWRRPGPNWLLPVVICFALALGMGAAPKQELLINLACLAHPPRSQSAATAPTTSDGGEMTPFRLAKAVWNFSPGSGSSHHAHVESRSYTTFIPDDANHTFTTDPIRPAVIPLTPADKWLLDLQRRIAAEERKKRMASHPEQGGGDSPIVIAPGVPMPTTSSPASRTIGITTTSSQLPLPSGPVSGLPKLEVPPQPSTGATPPSSGPWKDDEVRPGEIDPRLCKKDPKTQAAAAKLSMTMTLCMGALSAVTTGFWGSLSDRYGRTKIMFLAICGLVASDIVLIIVATYPHKVPGGYRFLLLGAVIDGLLGGMSTFAATNNAYLSDSTPDGSRAKMFSRFQGIMMCGFSVGPVLGSMIIKATGNIMSVFYVAVTLFTIFAFFVYFILPESLSSEARAALAKVADAKALRARQKEQAEREWENESEEEEDMTETGTSSYLSVPQGGESGWSRMSTRTNGTMSSRKSKRGKKLRGALRRFRRRALGFARPLGLFIPKDKEYRTPGGNIVIRKDWNLTFLAMATFFAATLMGLLQLKGQFLIFSYGWSSVELGPYMTLLGTCRAIVLLVIFPVVIKFFKPKLNIDEPAPVLADATTPPPSGPGILRSRQALADARFDLRVIRLSLLFDTLTYIGMSFVLPAPAFVFLTAIVTLGSCTGAAQSSLALNLVDSAREAGRLFGAMSVLTAMSSTFLGPLVFSLVYANTVSVYAPAIFIVAVGMLTISQVWLAFVRLPNLEEPTQVEVPRGRTRRVKRVKSSASSAGQSSS